MLAILAAVALTPAIYHIDAPINYDLDIQFEGFLPILGLDQAKIDLQVGLLVKGLSPESDGNPRASADVSSLNILLNGAKMPFTKENVAQYFPNIVTLNPQGKVLKNNAPDMKLPFELPGLDIKRFPDLTFLAVEFPAEGVEVGKSWTYSRDFGPSKVNYTVTPTAISAEDISMDVKLTQDYEVLENDAHQTADNPKDAVSDVKTHVDGSGTVDFDPHAGLIKSVHMNALATSTVQDIGTKKETTRTVKTAMTVALKGPLQR
jgi:hypothetical protein